MLKQPINHPPALVVCLDTHTHTHSLRQRPRPPAGEKAPRAGEKGVRGLPACRIKFVSYTAAYLLNNTFAQIEETRRTISTPGRNAPNPTKPTIRDITLICQNMCVLVACTCASRV